MFKKFYVEELKILLKVFIDGLRSRDSQILDPLITTYLLIIPHLERQMFDESRFFTEIQGVK
jgi:hypothetical protein